VTIEHTKQQKDKEQWQEGGALPCELSFVVEFFVLGRKPSIFEKSNNTL